MANIPQYCYQTIEGDMLRLLELLPGQYGDDIHIRIIHRRLIAPTIPAAHQLSKKQLQDLLPKEGDWRVFVTPEGRFVFSDYNADDLCLAKYTHPNPAIKAHDYAQTDPAVEFQPRYEALSYVWGLNTGYTHDIFVRPEDVPPNSKSSLSHIRVGKNLELALRDLRLADDPRILWIDAICINQQDVRERAAQVPRMTDIYPLAWRVVAWLGTGDQNVCQAIPTLRKMGEQFEITKEGHFFCTPTASRPEWVQQQGTPLPFDERVWDSISAFFDLEFFKRVWVKQEIDLANPRAVFLYGGLELEYYYLRRAVIGFRQRNDLSVGSRKLFAPGLDAYGSRSLSMLAMVGTRLLRCTEPRDHIYGLLGLMGPRHRKQIEVSYSATTAECYRNAFHVHSAVTERLDLLTRCATTGHGRGSAGLPSWVPDWAHAPPSGRLGSARLWSFHAAGTSRSQFEIPAQDPNILAAAGVDCGPIIETHKVSQEGAASVMNKLGVHSLETLDRSNYVNGERMSDAILRTLVLDMTLEKFPGARYRTLAEWRSIITETAARMESSDTEDETRGRSLGFMEILRENAVIRLKGGCLGIAPDEVEAGDHICVLLGCFTPLVLRPAPLDRWTIIGGCYLHGYMEGEALLGTLPLGWKIIQERLDGDYFQNFINIHDGKVQSEDPRLSELPPYWSRIGHERHSDDPRYYDYFRNSVSGETRNSDPRLDVNELKRSGVKLQTFEFV